MSRFTRIESSRLDRRLTRFMVGATVAIGLVLGGALGAHFWPWLASYGLHLPKIDRHIARHIDRDEVPLSPSGQPLIGRYGVDVIRVLDGDTFEARVHVWIGHDFTTRVRLRGIDAPEMKARCAEERVGAEKALDALRAALDDRDVSIWNIGADKYFGRVVAEVGTRRTPDVSAALLKQGLVRSYDGGRRDGWC